MQQVEDVAFEHRVDARTKQQLAPVIAVITLVCGALPWLVLGFVGALLVGQLGWVWGLALAVFVAPIASLVAGPILAIPFQILLVAILNHARARIRAAMLAGRQV